MTTANERTVYHVRMAKADPEEVEKLREFMATLGEMIEDPELDNHDIACYATDAFPEWERTVYGYSILVENCCDPSLSYLDWKPELKHLAEAQQQPAAPHTAAEGSDDGN